jgi:hypothetical protein
VVSKGFSERPITTMENIVVGVMLGGVLTGWSAWAQVSGTLPHFSPTVETFFLAAVLTAVVAWIPFQIPTPWAETRPWLAQVALGVIAGVVSLFFDSFAVVLLIANIATSPAANVSDGRHRFNEFAFRAVASFNALTVGGAFYIGELWGLPYYISSHMDRWWTGIPLMSFVIPYCVMTSVLAASLVPVRFRPAKAESGNALATFEMIGILLVIITTHNTALGAGILLLWSALVRRDTNGLIQKTAHEVQAGGANALALIAAAIVVQQLPGVTAVVARLTEDGAGPGTVALAAVSSPFAGAMLPPAGPPVQFYHGIANLMVGAPLFVWSSLVAIMVFKSHVAWADLPLPERMHRWKLSESVAEYALYSVIAVPLAFGLWIVLTLALRSGAITALYASLAGVLGP